MNKLFRTLFIALAITVTLGAMVAFTLIHAMPYEGYYIATIELVVWRDVGMVCAMACTIAGLVSTAILLATPSPTPAMSKRGARYPNLFPNG